MRRGGNRCEREGAGSRGENPAWCNAGREHAGRRGAAGWQTGVCSKRRDRSGTGVGGGQGKASSLVCAPAMVGTGGQRQSRANNPEQESKQPGANELRLGVQSWQQKETQTNASSAGRRLRPRKARCIGTGGRAGWAGGTAVHCAHPAACQRRRAGGKVRGGCGTRTLGKQRAAKAWGISKAGCAALKRCRHGS